LTDRERGDRSFTMEKLKETTLWREVREMWKSVFSFSMGMFDSPSSSLQSIFIPFCRLSYSHINFSSFSSSVHVMSPMLSSSFSHLLAEKFNILSSLILSFRHHFLLYNFHPLSLPGKRERILHCVSSSLWERKTGWGHRLSIRRFSLPQPYSRVESGESHLCKSMMPSLWNTDTSGIQVHLSGRRESELERREKNSHQVSLMSSWVFGRRERGFFLFSCLTR